MRIAIVCNDTQGGVQPYVALGAGLMAEGYEVQVVGPAPFEALVRQSGLPFAALSFDSEQQHADATALAEKGTLATMRAMIAHLPRHIAAAARATMAACEGADIITGGVGGMITGLPAAERLGVPFIETHLQPVGIRSSDFPGLLVSGIPQSWGRTGIALSHQLTELALAIQFKPAMAMARRTVGAPRKRARRTYAPPSIYGFSRHVIPVTTDAGANRHVVGYWTLPVPASWEPPPGLDAFLGVKGPVVSIGFGSMGSTRPEELALLIKTAARMAKTRAVVLSGWAKLTGVADDDTFFVKDLPHEWLFPRMSAVVHHGGAGTTGAALKAGVPSIVVPFGVDQPFWGARVAQLGVGPAPLPRKRLTADLLAERILAALSNRDMQARAAALGTQIRAENGVENAVKVFGSLGRSA